MKTKLNEGVCRIRSVSVQVELSDKAVRRTLSAVDVGADLDFVDCLIECFLGRSKHLE